MDLYVGTSGYSYKEWKGSFYPKDLPAKQMLRYYGERFGAVEINNSFYRMPTALALEAWARDVPPGFKFVLKAPQRITHIRRLKEVGDLVSQFVDVAATLGGRLGPLLFQLPPNMKKDMERLRGFLELVPTEQPVALEFRHPSWFGDDVFSLLRARNAALCIADAEGDVEVPFVSSADWGYMRLRRPEYDDADFEAWMTRAQAQGWRRAFVFFKHEDEGTGPRFANRFLSVAGRM